MKTCVSSVVALSMVVTTSFAAAPTLFAEVKLDAAKLKAFGERFYMMDRMVKKDGIVVPARAGRMSLKCVVDGETIRLTNRARMFGPDGKRIVDYRQQCTYPAMNLRAMSELKTDVAFDDGEEIMKATATVQGTELVTVRTRGDRATTSKSPWPAGAVTDLAVFYMVTIVPRDAGKQYSIDKFVSTSSPSMTESRILECAGPDADTGKPGKAWTKYLLYAPDSPKDAMQFWISDDGVLERVQLNQENRMELERKASE